MDSDDIDAGGDAESSRCERRLEALLGRNPAHDAAQGRFARGAQEDGLAQLAQSRELAQGFQVVLKRLPESEARVDDQVLARDADLRRAIQSGPQVAQQLRHEVGVVRRLAVVHDDHRDVPFGGQAGHGVVGPDAPDVVEERRPRLQGSDGDLRLGSIDADRDLRQRGMDCGDDRHDAGGLLGCRDGLVTRPCRFPANVENVSSFLDHSLRLDDRRFDDGGAALDRGQQAVAGERIGRDVHDPHDVGAAAPLE